MKACIYCDKMIPKKSHQDHIAWHLGQVQDNKRNGELSPKKSTNDKETQTDIYYGIENRFSRKLKPETPSTSRSERIRKKESIAGEQALLSEAVWNQSYIMFKATPLREFHLEASSLRHFSTELTNALNTDVARGVVSLENPKEKLDAKITILKSQEYGVGIEGLTIHVKTTANQTVMAALLCNVGKSKPNLKKKDPFTHHFRLALIKSAADLMRSLCIFLKELFSCTLTPAKLSSERLQLEFTSLLDWCQELDLPQEELTGILHYSERDVTLNLGHLIDILPTFLDISTPLLEPSEVTALFTYIQEPYKEQFFARDMELEGITMPQALIHKSGKIKIKKQEYVPSILKELQKLISN